MESEKGKLFVNPYMILSMFGSMVIDNGVQRVAIVSADLLIIPPTVTALLEKELFDIGFTLDNTYLGATHTHNSIGNWGKGVTSLLYGSFDDSIVHFIADKIKLSIVRATQNMLPSILKADSISIPEGVYNRVADGGPVDPLLRVLGSKCIGVTVASYCC